MNKTKKLSYSAIFLALTFLTTKYISIPTSIGGNINLGESIHIIASLINFPLASAIGASLSDLFSPYSIYTLATLLIKSLSGLTISKLNKLNIILRVILGEIIMVLGYFLFEAFVLKFGVVVASYEIINNLIQASISSIVAISIYFTLKKSSLIK